MEDNRIGLLQWVLGEQEGYVGIASRVARDGSWHETVYNYPDHLDDIAEYLKTATILGDLYFCPTLLVKPKRIKDNVRTSLVAWADLDECDPENLKLKPTLTIQTSPGRWQAYWRFDGPVAALDVEDINRRIAYAHADQGCDKSGWDLTQLLRIPGTKNYKRLDKGEIHSVKVVDFDASRIYKPSDFNIYPAVAGTNKPDIPFPRKLPNISADDIMERVRASIHPRTWELFRKVPEGNWSKSLWELELLLIGAGVPIEEVFIVAKASACNKYARDGRSDELLWKDVCRAKAYEDNRVLQQNAFDPDAADWYLPDKDILSDTERELAKGRRTIVDDYIDWAKSVGDAAPQYHEAGAFMLLSALLAGSVKLPTSFGTVIPNLWFMILADTTLTRKTTAMDMAMDLLIEIDSDAMLATDGSIEGLLTSLSTRPGKPSVFLRDEFSGLLEQMTKKDYMAGMLAMFTKLYDGKIQKRLLRKETIEVRDPVLILFTGGIRERIYSLMTYEHIDSGFVPRFIFITAESDIARIRPLGPPTAKTLEEREDILLRFRDVYEHYNQVDPDAIIQRPSFAAELTTDAWQRYNKFEYDMLSIGTESSMAGLLTPVMQRLCVSGLKAAVLIAAADRLTDKVVVTESDLIQAFLYVERWKTHALNVVANAGKTATEKQIERIFDQIQKEPGVLRSTLMQRNRLVAREADNILTTLTQRGMVRIEKGRGEQYFPTRTVKVKESA